MINKLHVLQKQASLLQKKNKYLDAQKLFLEIFENKNINFKLKASVCFHLAQIENDFDKKKEWLNKCLNLEPNHNSAKILLKCLTKNIKLRLEKNNSLSFHNLFNKEFLNVQIETSSKCNAKCIFCPYIVSLYKDSKEDMSDKTFFHIINMLKNIPLNKVCVYLSNEPLLDNKIFERIEIIKKELNFKLIEFSTNLSLFTEKNIKKLCDTLKDINHEVWISWHGITKDKYEKLMGLDFDKNLEKLKLYIKFANEKIKTRIQTIIAGKLHKGEVYSTEKEAIDFFEKIIKEQGINPEESSIKIYPFKFHNRAGNFNIKSTYDKKYLKQLGKLHPDCKAINEWLYIQHDGSVILCCMDFNKEQVLGNINDYNLIEDLFCSEKFIETKKRAEGLIKTSDNFICKRCIGSK